jgi:alanine dehydrogenase
MQIGVVKEIKNNENRVGMTPDGVSLLVKRGHEVFIEIGAGLGSGIKDEEYLDVGAHLVSAEEAWKKDLVVKVKEPLASEFKYFRPGLMLFTFLHLAAEEALTQALLKNKVTGIAYETVEVDKELPLLRPMSEVAGRRSVIVAATYLEKHRGGRGILLSGVPGVAPGNVVIIGGGVSGISAARMAIGLGAKVTLLEISEQRLRKLEGLFGNQITLLKSNPLNVAKSVKDADVLISTVLIPGAKATKIVSEEMVKSMPEGSVVVDVSVDQGGSIETIDRITTHDEPVYVKHGVLHYSVANMPGATPRTSTYALTNATTEYIQVLAEMPLKAAAQKYPELLLGLNTYQGHLTYQAVADAFNLPFKDPKSLL